MFALAANGFNKPSETFIRSHARLLAPGNTLLIAERRERKTPINAPLVMMAKRWPISVSSNATIAQVIGGALTPARLGKTRSEYLASILRKHGVTTIMAEYGTTAIHLMDAAQLAEAKLYVHFHGVDGSKMLRDPAIVASYKQLFAQAEGVVAPSAFLAGNLASIGCPTEKLHVVPCGVDTDGIAVTKRTVGKLIAVGRFTDKKAPLSTIAAFAQVLQMHPDAQLEMLGDGPLLADAKAKVEQLNLTKNITLPGMVTAGQVRDAMHNASIFIQHSVTAANGDVEGLPVAILEAMAAGLPVVSTVHSGIPEAVADGETGLLVHEHDVAAMATQINTLLDDPKRAETLGMAGRQRVKNTFSQEITNGKLRTLMGL